MAIDFYKLKRKRLDMIRGQETINQIEHCASAGAKLVMSGILVPGTVMTDDISAAATLVEAATICRIEVGSTTYVAFSDLPSDLATVDSATSPAIKLVAGIHLVVATGDFIKASTNPTRIELIKI